MSFDLLRLQSSCTAKALNRTLMGRHVLRYHATYTPVIIARYPISSGILSPSSWWMFLITLYLEPRPTRRGQNPGRYRGYRALISRVNVA